MCTSARPHASENRYNKEHLKGEEDEQDNPNDFDPIEEEEDPYNLFPEGIYDTVDTNPAVMNRPPAPIPRTESESDPEKPMTVISRGTDQFLFCCPLKCSLSTSDIIIHF